jgi:hypothetical protein
MPIAVLGAIDVLVDDVQARKVRPVRRSVTDAAEQHLDERIEIPPRTLDSRPRRRYGGNVAWVWSAWLCGGGHLDPRGGTAAPSGYRMFTARETTRPIVTSETTDWTPMMPLAVGESGIVSVGENAVALVSDT